MAERDDYFYCGQFDCPGEHPIPGMTCPEEDDSYLDKEEPDDFIEVEEPDVIALPWCPGPDTCTDPAHKPAYPGHRRSDPVDSTSRADCNCGKQGKQGKQGKKPACPVHYPSFYASVYGKHRAAS